MPLPTVQYIAQIAEEKVEISVECHSLSIWVEIEHVGGEWLQRDVNIDLTNVNKGTSKTE